MPAKGQRLISPEVAERVYRETGTCAGAARQLGVSVTAIIGSLRSAGIETSGRNHSDQLKAEAVRLYTEEKMSVPDLAKRLGVESSGLARHIKKLGLSRTTQEAHALAARDKTGRRGAAGWWQSAKSGKWETADSRYELVRMSQLDADEAIESWTKITPIIQCQSGKKYLPDFLIKNKDGSTVLEEVKPARRVGPEMIATGKLDAALIYCRENGMTFRVITENEIGVNTIRTFVMTGLIAPQEEERIKRKKQVDQDYRDKNRDRENSRTLDWYHANRDRELEKRRARKAAKKDN